MIVGNKVEIRVELSAEDRERLERMPVLERKVELLEARLAAASSTSDASDAVYLSPKRFAARWDVSQRLVRAWLTDGLPHETCGSRLVRIPVTTGDAWVRGQRGGQ